MLLHHIIPTKMLEVVDITADKIIFSDEEDTVPNIDEVGEVSMLFRDQVI